MNSFTKSLKMFKLDLGILSDQIKIQQPIYDAPRTVTQYHYCRSTPQERTKPHLVALSKSIIQQINLDYESLILDKSTPEYLSGTSLMKNSQTITNNYCGYQFGNWAGQLGDGRAHTLGFYTNDKNNLYELQLKGSGKTPFSRFADGNSVVSSALREFLASQAMHFLNVPTTRAASLVVSDDLVRRDPYYDGNIKLEKAAIILRICPSFLRFGSFEICLPKAHCFSKDSSKNREMIKPLADHLLKYHYKQIDQNQCDPYEAMYIQISKRSAKLVAKWQSIGFVQGVLNTDNMSMVGVTIDYGPFAFIDYFSKDYVSNMTDKQQRYSYRRQPEIIKWNLKRLAEAFDHLVPQQILKQKLQQVFDQTYQKQYNKLMHQKLGISQNNSSKQLINSLFDLMDKYNSNFTNVFRILSEKETKQKLAQKLTGQGISQQLGLKHLRVFPQLIGLDVSQIFQQDDGQNRSFVQQQSLRIIKYNKLKNTQLNQYISEQTNDWINWLQKYLSYEIDYSLMSKVNPKYILRNDVASNIVFELNQMDNSEQVKYMQKILSVFENPYEYNQWFEQKFWIKKCDPIKLTCSS